MNKLIVATLLCFASIQLLAQQPPPKDNKKQIQERKEVGKGKPRLFTSASASISKQRNAGLSGNNISSILNNAFNTAKPGDTLLIPFNSKKPMQAVVMANVRKSTHVTVMNLKVVNYQNAFMRLLRNTTGGNNQLQGLVHHPGFSDALSLKTTGGTVSFQAVDQSKIINE